MRLGIRTYTYRCKGNKQLCRLRCRLSCEGTVSVDKHSKRLHDPNIPWEASQVLAAQNYMLFQFKWHHLV